MDNSELEKVIDKTIFFKYWNYGRNNDALYV